MSLETQYNLRSPGVKRLMREAKELANPTDEYYASPLEDNLFEWHFTVRGPPETEFEGGFYHGRILLPPQYPMQPPNIILLTPNGRFEINKKICLSISGYHPETWQPSWSIRTALLALIAFMPTKGAGTIGSLDYSPDERRILAKKSKNWECANCGRVADRLIDAANAEIPPELTQEESSLLKTIALKSEDDINNHRQETENNNSTQLLLGEKPPPLETDSSSADHQNITRRNTVSNSTTNSNVVEDVHDEITDEILRASIERSKRDRFWSFIIYIIIACIILLIIRRLYYFL